jgi:hypothetical protein
MQRLCIWATGLPVTTDVVCLQVVPCFIHCRRRMMPRNLHIQNKDLPITVTLTPCASGTSEVAGHSCVPINLPIHFGHVTTARYRLLDTCYCVALVISLLTVVLTVTVTQSECRAAKSDSSAKRLVPTLTARRSGVDGTHYDHSFSSGLVYRSARPQ